MAHQPKERSFSFGELIRKVSIDPNKPGIIREDRGVIEIPDAGFVESKEGCKLLGVRLPDHALPENTYQTRKKEKPATSIRVEYGIVKGIQFADASTSSEERSEEPIRQIVCPIELYNREYGLDHNLVPEQDKSSNPLPSRENIFKRVAITLKAGITHTLYLPASIANSPNFQELIRKGDRLLGSNAASQFIENIARAATSQVIECVIDFNEAVKDVKRRKREKRRLKNISRGPSDL